MRKLFIALAASTLMSGYALAQTGTTTTTGNAMTTEAYVTAKPTDMLSSNLVGLNVTNGNDENIGEIKDMVISDGALSGYIVSVGGFLGMGERYVVVAPSALKINYSDTDKEWMATMDATKEQLKSAPEFKYDGRWAK